MKKNKLWTGLSSVFSFLLCFAIIGTNCALGYASTINGALGITTSKLVSTGDGDTEDTEYYKSGYGELNGDNLKKLIADTHAQTVTEEEEGAVLLKNDNNALPLSPDELHVTLFGHAVVQPLFRNSSAGSNASTGEEGIDLYHGLKNVGFSINDTLFNAYANSPTKRGVAGFNFVTQETTTWDFGEEDISFYTDELKASWENDYNDVAIVMLARQGGEGSELFMEDPEEGISQLALHKKEKDLLNMIKASGKFKKTIVLVNSGNPMELGWLEEYGVDACLWIGCPGEKGFEGVANILTGAANPSGRLAETYAVNSLSAPACVNNSFNNQTWTNLEEVLKNTGDSEEEASYYAVQAEGIYIGYKYYETRYEDLVLGRYNANGAAGSSTGNAWNYTEEVTYPFGYGLSYTTFEQRLDSVEVGEDTVKVQITVTNTGSVAGKSAVQVYAQTPYGEYEQKNFVEKSAIQLLDFGKTGLLQPGESETLTIQCDKYLLASYDYVGAKGYILSEGAYYISIGDDAHDALNNILAAKGAQGMVDLSGAAASGSPEKTYTWTGKFDDEKYSTSSTGVRVTNQFDDANLNHWIEGAVTYLSRSDWQGTYPAAVQVALTDEMMQIFNGELYEKPADAPSVSDFTQGDNQGIPLVTMLGVDYHDSLWETFLNQMTIGEMATLIADSFGTKEVTSIDKPAVAVGDGPDGIGGMVSAFDEAKYGFTAPTNCYTNESILASTFNKELMERRGALMGEEGLFLSIMENWGPGADLHRTPFGGRNFEYFSEDANMNYLCEIPYVTAMQSKGVNAGPKHITGNDQENNREGVACFFNEQAFREGSLRGFEGAVVKGNAHALMQGFNRLGLIGCSSSTALNTQVIRNEWGFIGHIETDATAGAAEGYKAHYTTNITAGTDSYCLDFSGTSTKVITEAITSNDDGYLLGSLRRAAHNILYVTVNSNIMNGYSTNSKVVAITPWWQPTMYGLIAFFAALSLLSLVMLTLSMLKEKKGNRDRKEGGQAA
ncbi:MAG TPA: beta-glucosidase [Clostridiales bacterium]|nr:beta-glucosidase [Clostridiales bacterium]